MGGLHGVFHLADALAVAQVPQAGEQVGQLGHEGFGRRTRGHRVSVN